VGSSKEISIIKKQIRAYARTNEPVLIVGETGTGKNIVAKALHKVSKKTGEYHAVNCSAFSCQLFESEMFGHEKGAFTGAINRKTGFFEKSHLGSLFLDEIGDLPSTLQPKILKVIEEKTFYRVGGIEQLRSNSRIISATGLNLSNKISSGHFRIDLFYRISTLSIQLPPLRQRKEDIPELVNYFLSQYSVDKKFTQKSINLICEQNWPGNVRQLFGFLTRCLTHYPEKRILEIIPEDFSCLYDPFHTSTKTMEVSL
jgi:transcriptional regulator with PAS, ATPase and Fis domain